MQRPGLSPDGKADSRQYERTVYWRTGVRELGVRVALAEIEMDTGIQCRASIDPAVVSDYAEQMRAGEQFPAVELFGKPARYWIGDGWHRIMAAKQIGEPTILANQHDGGRHDALKCALAANAKHGQRRTNADKRRCVEIAVAEFASLSSRAIGALCGVDHTYVLKVKGPSDQVVTNTTSRVSGSDGKQYPAKRSAPTMTETAEPEPSLPTKKPVKERVQDIAAMLREGHNPAQIADSLGVRTQYVRDLIRDNDLGKLDRRGKGGAKLNPAHVVEETVNAVAATGHGLRLIRNVPIDISRTDAAAMLAEMTEAMQSLRWLVNVLKGLANG